MPTLVLKKEGSPINGYVFSSFVIPVLARNLSNASVSFLCWAARIIKKLSSSALTYIKTSS